MRIEDITAVIDGKVVNEVSLKDKVFKQAFSSDLMSDVLTLKQDSLLLITGLVNPQTIRTAEMADISCIIFVRNKRVSPEMAEIAQEAGIALVECRYSMFKTSGLLYQAGINPVY
jgi:hypothetical protein